jgi:uncharacterized protein YndB with AHSA1/START domain
MVAAENRETAMGMVISHLNVRRSTFISATPARVWREFETQERIKAWFGRGHTLHTFEPKPGGKIDMSVDHDFGSGHERRGFGGRVVVWEPEREVSAEINWNKPHDWPVPMLWTIRLTPLYDGTQVEIFHHGFERLGLSAGVELEGYEEGWTNHHLKALRTTVEGG